MIVIKYGGHAGGRESFVDDVIALHKAGEQPVVVHGGGPQISAMLSRLDITSKFRNGLRVTTPEVMEVARMVLGLVGKDLATLFSQRGVPAVGLSGEDGGLITAVRVPQDIGLVGDVESVNPSLLQKLVADGYLPVVSTVAADAHGIPHNLNADTGAAALAVALEASQLMMLTDVAGVYADWPNLDSLIPSLNASEVEALLPALSSGMIPKMQACLRAVRGGVSVASVGSAVSSPGTKVTL